MPLILPNDLANDILADGEKLQQNFLTVEDYINQDVIARDGGTAMTGSLLLPGPPTQSNQAATKAYVDSVIASAMVGEIKMYGGDAEPPNWMFCRGQAISRFTYASLYQIFGNKFGGGDGSTTFNLPDMKGQYPVGYNPGGTYFSIGVGERAGTPDSTVPAHTHDYSHAHAGAQTGGRSAGHTHTFSGSGGTSGNTTQGSAHHYHSSGDANFEGFTMWDAHGVSGQFGGVAGAGLGVMGTTSYAGADHVHGFSANITVSGTTSGESADHSHTFNTPVHNGSTSSAGGSATNTNLPPGLSLNFIVRVV